MPVDAPTAAPLSPPVRGKAAALAPPAVALAALAASYATNIQALALEWRSNPSYSHGFLVPPIALAVLWRRLADFDPSRGRPSWWGWGLLAVSLVLRAALFERNEQWLEHATFLPALAGLALTFGGPDLLRRALPAIAFLALMLPLPARVNLVLAGPLQGLATIGGTALLQVSGLPAVAEGNVILIGSERLEVAQACNGLSMLLSFATLIGATVLLHGSRPTWQRVALLLSTVPIALIANVARISATAWAYHTLGPGGALPPPMPALGFATVERLAHDTAGWAMMPMALVLIALELRLLSWLVIEEERVEAPMVLPPRPPSPPS